MTLPLLFIWLFSLVGSPATQDGDLTLSARAGFDSLYKESAAVPVVVSVRNSGAPFEGQIRVSASTGVTGDSPIYSAPISLPSGSDKRVPLVVHVPPFSGALSIELFDRERVVATVDSERLNGVTRDELLYGVVSSDGGGLAFLETITGGRADAAVAFLDLADLPDVSSAWNALDILVLDDVDTSRMTSGQLAALRAWVESGGQLVVTGGPGGPRTAAGVADLLPVTVTGVESRTDLSALSERVGEPFDAVGPYVIARSVAGVGDVLVEQDGLPLLTRGEIGRGSVYFLALDPKSPPLAGWPGGDSLWAEIATAAPVLPPWGKGVRDGFAATQAVAYIPGLRLPSIVQLVFFLLLYTLIIGPVNFLILRRINRRELAWVTIPVLVLLFSAATFLTGFRTRGNSATLNTMSVAFGSVNAERLQTQSVLGLYSPRRARYDISLPYDSTAFPFQQAFGSLFGASNLDTIERASDLALRGVRTDTSEVATFIVEAHQPRPPVSATATLAPEGDVVEVTVVNDAGVTLEDAVLIYGQDQMGLGDLAAGEESTVQLPIRGRPPSSVPTPDPLFPTGSIYPNPLINDPSLILGTSDYFNDPVAYPRWQLIQAHYGDEISDPSALPDPAELVTLGGWLAGSVQDASVLDNGATQTGVTLLLLEIPVR